MCFRKKGDKAMWIFHDKHKLTVMWIRIRSDTIILASRIRLAKNRPKSWEARIKIVKNYQNIIYLKIEVTLFFTHINNNYIQSRIYNLF